ncbi:MAG: uL30 family ribosomal protein [Candidatus Nanohaloarchaea archaeon]
MIAAVRVRGPVDVDVKTEDSLRGLGLEKKNQLVVLQDTDSTRGMLEMAKDYIAYGEISEELVEAIDAGEGEPVGMTPPSKGFRDTRKQHGQGGTLGERPSMDDLVRRMM